MAFAGPSPLLRVSGSTGALRSLASRREALWQDRLTVLRIVVAVMLGAVIFSARKGLGTVVVGATNHLLASYKRLFAFGGVSVRQQQPVRQGIAPWDTGWNNTVGLCAIMAEEHAEDVREWLQYYRRAHLLPAHTGTLACSVRQAGSMLDGQAVTGTCTLR